jgi:PilZ domain
MSLRRKLPKVSPWASAAPRKPQGPPQKRKASRVKPLDADRVFVRLVVPGSESVEAAMIDLAMSGAGLSVPFQVDPCLEPGSLIEIRLEHLDDGWCVDTPARVAHTRQYDDTNVFYGLEFLNSGNLYAQMDDAWAHYFNRRQEPHYGVDLDEPIRARLRQRQHRLEGPVIDVSHTGLSVRVPHQMASTFELGKNTQVVIDAWSLPGEYELCVTVENRRTVGEWDYLGMSINKMQAEEGAAAREVFREYVEKRRLELEARDAELRDSAA